MGEAKIKMEGTFVARPATRGLMGEAMALSAYPLDQPLQYVSIEWALIFVWRSANVNLTQLDQNDLPRILLKSVFCVSPSNIQT